MTAPTAVQKSRLWMKYGKRKRTWENYQKMANALLTTMIASPRTATVASPRSPTTITLRHTHISCIDLGLKLENIFNLKLLVNDVNGVRKK